jgi:hypothetical protein
MAKQRQTKMQYRVGSLQAMEQLEHRTDEQLLSESKHKAAARALLGARAAERYEAKEARRYFNEALAGCHPQERPYLRQMMKAALAQAERRPEELRDAMEKLGQEPPSARQMLMLRLLGLVAPPSSAGVVARIRGILLLLLIIVALCALGFGLVALVSLPFGGLSWSTAVFFGVLLVAIALAVLVVGGRRRQAKSRAAQEERAAATAEALRRR